MFSRNAASSRAIPVSKVIEQVETDPAMPIHWGKNQPGMQAKEEVDDVDQCIKWWYMDSGEMAVSAHGYSEAGVHKQVVNRLLEPFQFVSVVVTATEFENFFKLRLHPDAQPEIHELARCMKEAMDSSEPEFLEPGFYDSVHAPYINIWDFTVDHSGGSFIDWGRAIKCSVARCARVSYLNHDNTAPDQEKDVKLHDRLLEAGHMSPFEHVARPMKLEVNRKADSVTPWEPGLTHMDRYGQYWSGNFRAWVQYRNLL